MQSRKGDTCETQRDHAEHNSVLETLKTGKQVVYSAPPCESPAPATAAPSKAAPAGKKAA